MNEQQEQILVDDIHEIKECLVGKVNPPTEGLIGKVAKHERFFKFWIWVGSIIFVALVSGCVTLWVT